MTIRILDGACGETGGCAVAGRIGCKVVEYDGLRRTDRHGCLEDAPKTGIRIFTTIEIRCEILLLID